MKRRRESRAKSAHITAKATAQPSATERDIWVGVLLCIATLAIYAQVATHQFVGYDDPLYVTENPHVHGGLNWANIVWALTSTHDANWFPLTWMSHMLDVQLFGLESGWHHMMSAFIHALSTVLLYVALHRMTGARSRSALVAFLFALHPLRVESVAWIAERKDVLSGFFWMLTLCAYVNYAKRPTLQRYALVMLAFCLGLLSKPMVVTLPIVLLLLDAWPLARGFRILEKIPFLGLSIAVALLTLFTHEKGGAVAPLEFASLPARIENTLVSYVVYILKFFWPTNLAVFYPYSTSLAFPAVLSGLVLVAMTVIAIHFRRRWPYLSVGWFWYLVTLLPVIGLIQTGEQARADRYTYLPMIGITIALVWGVSDALRSQPRVRFALAAVSCALFAAFTFNQIGYWRDDTTLFEHAATAVPDNYVARFNLATAYENSGRHQAAAEQLRETLRIRPYYAAAHAELGQLLAKQGDVADALGELESAVKLTPRDAVAHFRLGSVLGRLGRNSEAAAEFEQAVRLQPGDADAHFNLGIALVQADRLSDAAREFERTVQLKPDDAFARFNYGIALVRLGQLDA